jgi:nucleoid DNA-binding protein
MKIGCYISELLDDHDFVVFPGLGAFTVREKSAQFDENNEFLMPPARQILFNEEIKINDGVLLNHVAHAEGIPAPKAHQELARLCEDFLYRLDHGETVEIENLGKLSRSSGKYNFEQFEEQKKYPGAFGLDPVKVIGLKKSPVTGAAPAVTERTITGEGIREKRINLRWLAIFLILAVAVFVSWMFISRNHHNLSHREKQEIAGRQQVMPVPVEPTPAEPTPVEIIENEDTEGINATSLLEEHPQAGLYYLIGGSFRTRENADQYYEQMSKNGFNPVHLGEIGKFHVVSIAYFSSEREAVSQQNILLKNDSASGVWIYSIPDKD